MDVYKDFIKMIIILCKFNSKELPMGFLTCNHWHGVTCGMHAQSDSATPWTVAHQAPLSMGFFRQEYWSGLAFLSSGYLLTQGSNPCLLPFLHEQAGSLPTGPPGKPYNHWTLIE